MSVILPTYCRDTELHRALASVAAQNFSDFEVVVVDDNDEKCWNEKVKNIVSEAREKYPMLEILLIENHPRQYTTDKGRNKITVCVFVPMFWFNRRSR